MIFQLGHKTFNLNENVISNYYWLNNMFDNGSIGETKNELKYNLNEYLINISRHKLRKLIDSMEKLEKYYNENIFFETDEYIIILENFLHNGPNEDILQFLQKDFYICKKCNFKVCDLPTKNDIIKHNIIDFNNNNKICSYCGILFNINSTKIQLCVRNNCIHDFQ